MPPRRMRLVPPRSLADSSTFLLFWSCQRESIQVTMAGGVRRGIGMVRWGIFCRTCSEKHAQGYTLPCPRKITSAHTERVRDTNMDVVGPKQLSGISPTVTARAPVLSHDAACVCVENHESSIVPHTLSTSPQAISHPAYLNSDETSTYLHMATNLHQNRSLQREAARLLPLPLESPSQPPFVPFVAPLRPPDRSPSPPLAVACAPPVSARSPC